MNKTLSASILTLSLSALSANALTVFAHTFDGVANETGPTLQVFDNGNSHSDNITTGALSGSGSGAVGFNTMASINLSSYSAFTIEFVVENNVSAAIGGFNGTFFGIVTNSPSAQNTDGTALYNNVGAALRPAIGLQIGNARGGTDNSEFAVDAGPTTYSPGLGNPADSVDGYTISITYADKGDSTTDVTIVSTGLDTDFGSTHNVAWDYATIFAAVTPNVSSQGGTLDLSSITITAVPEPSTFALLAGSLALTSVMIRRRRS